MQSSDIKELFDLQNVLAKVTGSVDADIVTQPEVLAALLDWKHDSDNGKTEPVAAPPKPPAKAAPSRSTGRKTAAKVIEPEPPADDDDDDDPGF